MEEIRASHKSRVGTINQGQPSSPLISQADHDRDSTRGTYIKKGILLASTSVSQNQPIEKYSRPTYHNENEQQLREYSSGFNEVIEHVNTSQMQELKKKYRYYLSKVEKLQITKKELEQSLANLDQIAENSPIIKEQKKSICFIEKISSETAQKLKELTKKVNIQKDQKKAYIRKIEQLKGIVKKQKDQFFELKRMQTKLRAEISNNQRMMKLVNANNTFITIISNKNSTRKKRMLKDQPSTFSKLVGVSSRLSNEELLKQQHENSKSKGDQQNSVPTFPNIDSTNMKHKYRLSCLSDLPIHKNGSNQAFQLNTASNQNYQNKFARSDTFEVYSLKQNQTSKSGKNKEKIVRQLSKMMKMKQQFLAETCKLQNSAFTKMQHRVNQIFSNIPDRNDLQNKGLSKRKEIKLNSNKCREGCVSDKTAKQCNACDRKLEQKQKQAQKYSLHQEDIVKHRIQYDCSVNGYLDQKQVCLLADTSTIQKLKQKQQQKRKFLQNSPQQIIKYIIQKDKIQEILSVLKKYTQGQTKPIVKIR